MAGIPCGIPSNMGWFMDISWDGHGLGIITVGNPIATTNKKQKIIKQASTTH
jgi:hypothetical protein